MITEGIGVINILSHKLLLLSGMPAPLPGIAATVTNKCAGSMSISLSIGYLDSSGEQFGTGIESLTLAGRMNRDV